jgi:hypothetical protein
MCDTSRALRRPWVSSHSVATYSVVTRSVISPMPKTSIRARLADAIRSFVSSNMHDPYQVLGVSRSASAADIKKAYFALAKRYHPDVNASTEASQRFREVSEAYELERSPPLESTPLESTPLAPKLMVELAADCGTPRGRSCVIQQAVEHSMRAAMPGSKRSSSISGRSSSSSSSGVGELGGPTRMPTRTYSGTSGASLAWQVLSLSMPFDPDSDPNPAPKPVCRAAPRQHVSRAVYAPPPRVRHVRVTHLL